MKPIFKLLRYSVIGGAIAAVAIPQISLAAPVKDSTGALYIDGLTPSGRATVLYQNATRTVTISSNACGDVAIRNSSSNPLASVTSITVNGASVDVSALPTDTIPRCTNGSPDVQRTANYKTAAGDILLPNKSPLTRFSIGFPGVPLSRSVTINACGFVRLIGNAQYPLTGTLEVDGTPIDMSSVSTGNPPWCRNNVLYTPQ